MEGKRKKRSEEEENKMIEDKDSLFHGVVFVAKRNKKKKFFLASKKNDFGGFNVETVMVDSGCNSMLLPLKKDDLPILTHTFPFTSFFWDIQYSSKSLTLKIYPVHPGKRIPINLCSDILHPDKLYGVEFLRFHLCLEDAKAIREEPFIFNNLMEKGRKAIESFLQTSVHVTRGSYALLGQAVLQNFVGIQHGSIAFAVDSQQFELIWNKLRLIERLVVGASSDTLTLPDHFDDHEDEYHAGDDEDYSLSDDDFVD